MSLGRKTRKVQDLHQPLLLNKQSKSINDFDDDDYTSVTSHLSHEHEFENRYYLKCDSWLALSEPKATSKLNQKVQSYCPVSFHTDADGNKFLTEK